MKINTMGDMYYAMQTYVLLSTIRNMLFFYTYPTIVRRNYDYVMLTFSAHYHT